LHSVYSLAPCDRIIAVVREDKERLRVLLQSAGIETVVNREAWRGMGSSIACGVKASHESDGWCILPADMPCVLTSTTALVVEALRQGAALAAPYYENRRGHPVGFSKSLGPWLIDLDGDRGARDIVETHADKLLRLETTDAGVLLDIDTTQQLAELEKAWQ
jgi:molybdenum cofactor cytidylyltransferase